VQFKRALSKAPERRDSRTQARELKAQAKDHIMRALATGTKTQAKDHTICALATGIKTQAKDHMIQYVRWQPASATCSRGQDAHTTAGRLRRRGQKREGVPD
jgi:hypothetical protein